MLTAIVVCEIFFWVVLLAGLSVRYHLRRRRLSWLLLASTPLIDVVLLVLTLGDLARGSDSHFTHGLSAFYIGYSVFFGPQTIRWLDRWAAYRVGVGRKPVKLDQRVRDSAPYQWGQFRKAMYACGSVVVILVACLSVSEQSAQFWIWYWLIATVFTVLLWFSIGPVRAMVGARR
ncbi:MAG: hypothetical protein U5O16_36925 [Rhodococcus sp. (in: high G+C Gram-positive bacteria)]|uniref:hypothetical protein n=1 Tax=Rhodococcus sp. TaxID=1831 RepID=UPI002ADBB2DF|nr:hypothetical protein [Rhodococcus sp. (in: high G+C Gram-positive bacteria)]